MFKENNSVNILGVHIGHDSSAALVMNGKIVADAAEERFSRIKHDYGLPIQAVDYCLTSQDLTIKDIDIIAVPSKGPVAGLNELFALKGRKREKRTRKGQTLEFIEAILGKAAMKPPLYIKRFPIKSSTEIIHVEHHLAHAASAYYTSGTRDKQLIVTMDGAGDSMSTCIWMGNDGLIKPLMQLPTHASLGWFYSNVTEALGWYHGDGEGKTMGLAPYGNYNSVRGKLDPFYPRFENGHIKEKYNYGRPYYWNEHGALQWHFNEAYAIKDLIRQYGRENIAAEAQRVLEEQTLQLVLPWIEREKAESVSFAGGVFLNVKLNQRLWEAGKIKHHHIFPDAGDSGLAAGAALYAYYQANPSAAINHINNVYLGPEYTDKDIESILKLRNLDYKYMENIEEYTARKLAQGKIVAWFQSRMESGPRALGNRSILMSANKAENKDIINKRVKFREAFRPFCPSLIQEAKDNYLEKARDEAFMITSFTCKPEKRDKIPAVVHADQTMRPQTVKKDTNQKYWKLINTFGDLTGEPLLLNTSFNIKGEPIVSHPREAIRCFFDNGLDILVMGNYVLSK